MNKQQDISAELYKDDIVLFLAERYHSTPQKIVQQFLVQDGIIEDEQPQNFQFEENEMEILRGLTHRNGL